MQRIILCSLCVVPMVLGIGYIPLPNNQPTQCKFNGPQDAATLRGVNFIQNVASDKCFTMKNLGISNKPIRLEPCSWSSLPKSDQLFLLKNSNGGSILKPSVPSFGIDSCIAPSSGQLGSVKCIPKSSEQTWRFQRVRNGPFANTLYQIIQGSSGRCIKADTKATGANISGTRCNSNDDLQLWSICTSNNGGGSGGNPGKPVPYNG